MKLLREPLVHFVVIGSVLFGAFSLVDAGGESSGDEIVISSGEIASIAATFSQTWQRAPNAKELESLLSERIRDEVFYRQGLAMGLDRDDAVVRRRIRQKMEFVADLTADVAPTDAELKAFVAEHPEWFRNEARFSFKQVYFPASSGAVPDALEVADLLRDLNSGAADASTAGSPFMAGADFRDLSKSDVARTFGEDFAASVDKAAPGQWNGPVASAYGTHMVRVIGRVEAREPPFEQVRKAAEREWLHVRKVAANDALYEKLRSRYVIKVEAVAADTVENRQARVTP
ncbi:peptidyl-prolyl cis-trans isomerase [Rhizobium laguerreae]|uniref:peptidylprolyl isomerase n=1 Tax=Rhizobium laguerreae TaxID=1076926 RepID=UPI001C924B16|nr:peptidylprolyl isomerase [Rhizobium laguerreae]MBY3095182.1 peptidyl-prolyl cis-trans isomerase [Rhizobium laguerreae]